MDVSVSGYLKDIRQVDDVKWIVDCHVVTEQNIENYLIKSDYYIIRTLLLELLNNSTIGDSEFFINPTSCPVLKKLDRDNRENRILYENMNILLRNRQEVEYRRDRAIVDKISKGDEVKYSLRLR